MVRLNDTTDIRQGELYVDTVSQLVLIISERESKFRSVDDYVNCSDREIEQRLQTDYGDTTLHLINCSRSAYYPKEATVLHFRVSLLPHGYDTYMMYFIHHRKRDVQLAFIYSQSASMPGSGIDAIMKTMKLK